MDFERLDELECCFEPNEIIYFRPIEELIEIRKRLRRNCEESNFEIYTTQAKNWVSSCALTFYEDEMLLVNEKGGAICRDIQRAGFGGKKLRVFFPHSNAGVWFKGHSFVLSQFLFVPEASFWEKDDHSIFDSSEYKSLFG